MKSNSISMKSRSPTVVPGEQTDDHGVGQATTESAKSPSPSAVVAEPQPDSVGKSPTAGSPVPQPSTASPRVSPGADATGAPTLSLVDLVDQGRSGVGRLVKHEMKSAKNVKGKTENVVRSLSPPLEVATARSQVDMATFYLTGLERDSGSDVTDANSVSTDLESRLIHSDDDSRASRTPRSIASGACAMLPFPFVTRST